MITSARNYEKRLVTEFILRSYSSSHRNATSGINVHRVYLLRRACTTLLLCVRRLAAPPSSLANQAYQYVEFIRTYQSRPRSATRSPIDDHQVILFAVSGTVRREQRPWVASSQTTEDGNWYPLRRKSPFCDLGMAIGEIVDCHRSRCLGRNGDSYSDSCSAEVRTSKDHRRSHAD